MLTVAEIKGLKPKSYPYYKWDSNGERGVGKLGIQVTPNGTKQFTFRYYIQGKVNFISLGRFPGLSLTKARESIKQYGVMLQEGLNPKAEIARKDKLKLKAERLEAQKGSVDQLFISYTKQMEKDGKRTFKAVLSALQKEVYPHIDPNIKAKDVTTHDIILILSHIIRRGAPVHSNRVRSYLMAAFNHGLKHDNDPANYIEDAKFGLAFNPVSSIPKQKHAEKVGNHFLSLEELRQLLWDMENELTRFKMGHDVRNLLSLCFYTGGQRPYELVSSRKEAINWEQKTLLIVADISKSKIDHLVPLTAAALQILRDQCSSHPDSEYIFPHRLEPHKHLRTDSLARAVSRYRETTDVRYFIPRDIRRTCKTLMGELGISKEIRDRLQNHALQDVSSKHYDRYGYLREKRAALESWENRLLGSEMHSNVINFPR